jgi:hypothetical protein
VVRKGALWTGIVAAVSMMLVPFVDTWLHPPKKIEMEQSVLGLAVFAFDVLGSLSHGIILFVWIVSFAAIAVIASFVAFIAAWRARESRRIKLTCWVPASLAGLGYAFLAALEA